MLDRSLPIVRATLIALALPTALLAGAGVAFNVGEGTEIPLLGIGVTSLSVPFLIATVTVGVIYLGLTSLHERES